MLTIDAQVHAYERNPPGRPWVGTLTGPAEVTGTQMVAAMDAVGVDGAILVSPFSMYRYDASYAKQVYAAHPDRFGLVKPVNPADPSVADTIADWADTAGTGGIRGFLRDNESKDPPGPPPTPRSTVCCPWRHNTRYPSTSGAPGDWTRRAGWRHATPTRDW